LTLDVHSDSLDSWTLGLLDSWTLGLPGLNFGHELDIYSMFALFVGYSCYTSLALGYAARSAAVTHGISLWARIWRWHEDCQLSSTSCHCARNDWMSESIFQPVLACMACKRASAALWSRRCRRTHPPSELVSTRRAEMALVTHRPLDYAVQ
jgi:hypothetical protein